MTPRYVGGRLAGAALTMLGVAVVVFLVLRALPGDAIIAKLGTESGVLDDAQRAALERYYGLDQPLPAQFASWLGSVVTGNLGVSTDSGRPVIELIAAAMPVTVELAILATLISTPFGVALGMLAASRPGRARDVGVQAFGLLGLALPEFVLASVLVGLLAVWFAYFPDPGIYVPLGESVAGNLSQMIYPALVLSVGLVANVMRTTRSAVLEVARADFVRTAHGKGLSAGRVRLRHVLHNASIPIVTIVGIQFGYLLGGTVIIEQIFALPGLGRLLLTGILQQDYAVVQSTTLLIAVAFVLVNLVVDLGYRLLDPRTRLT
ncbi:MAG: ABC transporter permease [Actinopolymorphaceae bacterium]